MTLECRCITCREPVTLRVDLSPGTTIYELVPPRGWITVPELARQPLTFFCLCPSCKRLFGPVPLDVDRGSPTVKVTS